MKSKVPEEVQRLIKTIYDDCVKEDQAVRERQIRNWRRLNLLWEGYQRVWFSEVAHDWRIYDDTMVEDADQEAYDKPINVFKAYLEIIIAALSVTVPPIKCFPDDADNTLDLSTARAGDKICELIYKHNKVSLLWLHALYIHLTEGMVACYSYPVEDASYGTYEDKEYKESEGTKTITKCSNCGTLLNEQENPQQEQLENDEKDEFMPGDSDAPIHNALLNEGELCPNCMAMMDPDISTEKFITTRLVGITHKPKSRICLEVYGGLYVKIPNYAHNQKEVPYLMLSKEIDYSMAVDKYEDLQGSQELIDSMKNRESSGSYNQYSQWGRLNPQYQGEYPINVVTVSDLWIRPGKYNILKNEDDIKRLKTKFPDGIKATFVNDCFGDAVNEALDDCWTLLENPLTNYLHFTPKGADLTSIQEITNDLISLVLQTIEHGIGQTLIDPSVLDFKAYQQTETTPGNIYPTKTLGNKRLQDSIYEFRTATLSAEVLPFSSNIQSMGQLVSGAIPSLFGGNLGAGASETASQYSMSRAQAMQRLQNTWKVFIAWWETIFGKVIPAFIDEVKEDERDVQRDDNGNFINVFIRKAELEGKIGKVEIEANENLPMTWAQRSDIVKNLLTNPNPLIQQILSSPENIPIIHESLGLDDLYITGEDYVEKQYDEIKLLLNSTPIPDPQMQNDMPSVDIDPIIDNNQIEFEICRKWLISEAGRQAKQDNPDGYKNVLLHAHAHFQVVQMQAMQQAQAQAPPAKPNPNQVNEAPITGEDNVQVTH